MSSDADRAPIAPEPEPEPEPEPVIGAPPNWGPPWAKHGRPPHWARPTQMHDRYAEWGPGGAGWRNRDWHDAPWDDEKWRRGAQRWFAAAVLRAGLGLLLLLGTTALLLYVVVRLAGGATGTAVALWVATLALLLLLPVLVWATRRTWRRIGEPLAALVRAAEAVGRGDLSVRVPETGRAELLRFQRTFNDMAAELERAETRRRTLTADVAHELRTPLQILQGNLEGVIDGVFAPTPAFMQDLLDETRVLARLVEDLRLLSLAEDGRLALEWEELDAAALARDAVGGWLPLAAEKQARLEVDAGDIAPGALRVRADRMRLTQALNNLLSNALRHVPAGGVVRVQLAQLAEPGGGWVQLLVFNTGEPIADEALPFLFDRFWRGDKARTREGGDAAPGAQSGLGLAIVRHLTEAMGGRVSVRNVAATADSAAGVEFALELPQV